MASKVAQIWQMKPVQIGAKGLAAGTVLAVSLLAFNTATKHVFGRKDGEALESLKREIEDPNDQKIVEYLDFQDPDLLDLLARLLPFRRFHPNSYREMFISMFQATEIRYMAYEHGRITATTSMKVRKAYQKLIEDVRIFRAIVEEVMPSAIEDFDDVAVDINAKVEQVCTDAIQDSVM